MKRKKVYKGGIIIDKLNELKRKILKEDIEYISNNQILSIDELLYNSEQFEKYKEWRHETKRGEKVEIVAIWPTDYGDIGCTAILYKNKKPVAKIMDSYDKSILKEVFPHKRGPLSKKMLEKSFKSLILNTFNSYINLPKINECSNLLQDIYTSVCESDAAMCHIDYNDWKEYYSEKYTTEDLEKLKEEIKKYKLEDVVEVDNGEYQILGYGNLQFMFNDTREFERESELEID